MRIAQGLLIGAVATAMGLAGLWQSGCDDSPTKPKPPEKPKDYPVYFMSAFDGTLFTYYPLSRRIDTAALGFGIERRVTVSADGKLLYLAGRDNVVVLGADSLNFIRELPYPACGGVAVSPDNSLLAIMCGGLRVLRTNDYGLVFNDTTYIRNGVFSQNNHTFYAAFQDTWAHPFVPYCVDVIDSVPFTLPTVFSTPVSSALPMPDGRKLLLYRTLFFSVYDIDRDTVIFNKGFWPGSGHLGVTVDGKYAFFSNPSTPFFEEGTTDLYVFDVVANQIADTIVIDDFLDSLGTRASYGIGRMVFTPDGRWMVTHNAQEPFELYLFDLEQMELVDFHRFSNNWFYGISVQRMK